MISYYSRVRITSSIDVQNAEIFSHFPHKSKRTKTFNKQHMSSPSPSNSCSALFKIGNSVSGVSSCGDPFGGVVYAVDDALGLAVLRAPGDIQNSHHVQIIRVDANQNGKTVKVINSVSPPPNSNREEEDQAPLPIIDKGRQERRFQTAVKAAQFVAGKNSILLFGFDFIGSSSSQ